MRLLTTVLFLISFALISACQSTGAAPPEMSNAPEWWSFENRRPAPVRHYDGFGVGNSAEQARTQALADIATQLKVRIQTEQTRRTTLNNNEASSFAQAVLRSKSDVVLTDYVEVKAAEKNGFYYAHLRYDDRSLVERLRSQPPKCSGAASVKAPDDWLHLLPISRLVPLGCSWELVRRGGVWRLVIGAQSWPVQASDIEAEFFTTVTALSGNDSEKATFDWVAKPQATGSVLPAEIRQGQMYFLRFLAPKLQGQRMHIYQVNQLGQVSALDFSSNSAPDEAQPNLRYFPDPKKYDGLEAALNFSEPMASSDMVLLAHCPANIPMSNHHAVSNDIQIKDESRYTFGRLLQDLQPCKVQSRIMRVIPSR